MGQDEPEALGRVFEVLAGGLGGAAYRRFGGRVQARTEPEQIHRASRSDGAHVVSRRAGDARATEGVAPLGGDTDGAELARRRKAHYSPKPSSQLIPATTPDPFQ